VRVRATGAPRRATRPSPRFLNLILRVCTFFSGLTDSQKGTKLDARSSPPGGAASRGVAMPAMPVQHARLVSLSAHTVTQINARCW
jgi:hypothetical protein